jgi:calcineurin-like phosphoesterase family protein
MAGRNSVVIDKTKKHKVISDPHLAHANIIKYCNRPFDSVEEHDWTIINRWNSAVAPEDQVYCLGDMAFGRGSKEMLEEYLPMLNGEIHLIKGNHDHETAQWYMDRGVYRVYSGEFLWYTPGVLLSHRPCPTWRPNINIHGHTHNLMHTGPSDIYVNVSADVINFTPVDLDELIEKVRNGRPS